MALELLAAKSSTENDEWHSITLLKHTGDVVQKALDLFNCIPDDLSAFGSKLSDKSFQKAVIKACILHDLGKISFEFQDSILPHVKGDWNENKVTIKEYLADLKDVKIGRHEYYSVLWSLLLLNNEENARHIQTAILYHHYNPFYAQEIVGGLKIYEGVEPEVALYLKFIKIRSNDFDEHFLNPLQTRFNQEVVKQALKEIKSSLYNADFDSKIAAFEDNESISEHLNLYESHLTHIQSNGFGESEYEFLLLLGCLRRSDYSASGNTDVEKPFLETYSDLSKKIASKIGNDAWQFKIGFKKVKDTTISIIQAPTGSGKTELALIWSQIQEKKLFYTLPLRIALNDIYQKRLVGGTGYLIEKSDQVSLLHSTAFLEYMKEKSDLSVGEKITISRMLSNGLYLSTIDQVFLSSLFYYGFDKLFGLYPYSCFVIDEIQSYAPEMMAVIFKTMEHIQKLGAPILIITATLPPYLTKILEGLNLKYSLIHLSDDKNGIKNYNLKRHLIQIKKEWICEYTDKKIKVNEKLLNEISRNRENNTLLIVNNVNKAINVFESLANIPKAYQNLNRKDSGLYLLHSRLLESEKSRRIELIKQGIENNEKGIIVVSTQLIEASVDFDFDILHSEWSPIDSLVQRMGRIHRNRDEGYTGSSPNIFVYVGDEDEPDKLTSMIYSEAILKV